MTLTTERGRGLRPWRRPLALAAAVVLLQTVLWSPGGAATVSNGAAAVPDLALRALTTQPVELVQRRAFQAKVTVRNTGQLRARGAQLTFFMSRDAKRSSGDVALGAPTSIAGLDPAQRRVMTATLTAPATLSGTKYLIACASRATGERDLADNCVSLARVVQRNVAENPDADPIEVDPVVQRSKAVTRTIGTEGGTLTTTGSDGTAYALEIPADALASPVEITMTPISRIDDSPYAGQVDGVELQPDGLHLANPATLRITPQDLLPRAERSPFAYRSEGTDFVLALFEVVGDSYEMPLLHFTGEGIAQGDRSQRRSVADSEPSSLESKHDNEVADAVLHGTANVEDLFDQHFDQHLRPALQWATTAQITEMHRVTAAVTEYLAHARQVQMLKEDIRSGTQQRIDAGWELVRQATNNMVRKAWAACIDDHQPEMVLTALALERQAALMGLDTGSGNVFDPNGYVRRCLRFEVDVRGTYTYNPPTGVSGYYSFFDVGYEGTIPVEIGGGPLEGGDSGMDAGGEADLVSFSQTFTEDCRRTPCTPCGGAGVEAVFDTPATVYRLDPDLSVIVARNPGGRAVKATRPPAITLEYDPGTSTEQWRVCGHDQPRDAYEPVFRMIHREELKGPDGALPYVITDWQFIGAEHWAQKDYDAFVCTSQDPTYGGCYTGFRERSRFDIIHAPQR